MLGRSIRSFCLVVAVWALLFAPGAFRGDTGSAEVVEETNRLAAAVIAPTFSADGLHVARPCEVGDAQTDMCDVVAGVVPAAAVVLLAAGLSTLVPSHGPTALLIRRQRTAPPRAPPKS